MRHAMKQILFFAISAALFAQQQDPSQDLFNDIDSRGMEAARDFMYLAEDDTIKPPLKSRAILRLSVLISSEENKSHEVVASFLKALGKNMHPKMDLLVRESTCQALASFRKTKSEDDALLLIEKILGSDFEEKVQVACAHSLGEYRNRLETATNILLKRLEIINAKQSTDPVDYVVTAEISRSLGELGHRKSYIPLMKILQSRYPISVKKEAQKAVKKIQW